MAAASPRRSAGPQAIGERLESTMAEYPAKHPPEMEPAHPGEILRADVLPALGLTVAEAARQLCVSRQMLHSILAGRSGVAPEMAVRLGRFCGNGASFWLRMQAAHDLWHSERKLRAEVRKIPEHAAA
ncbi:MAG: HigA family addiction module antitoxin [Gammaproteobacteria bacterium]